MSTPTQERTTHRVVATVRRRPGLSAAVTVVGLALLGVALWLFQPWALFVDVTVDEAFPAAAPVPAGDASGDGALPDDRGVEPEQGAAQEEQDVLATEMADDEAEDAAGGDGTDPVATTEAAETAPPAPAGPVALLTGEFVSRDHVTSGTATVYRLDDGSLTLRIEDLATDNGPDLFVYLDDDAADAAEGDFDDGISVGRLKGNQGNQNYEIPADLDLDAVSSVVIWCDRFASAFGAVDLVPVG